MKTKLLKVFENIPYFTIEAFRQTSGMDNPHNVRMLLSRWVQNGLLIRLKKGVYMTGRFADIHSRDEAFQMAVSSILLPQSYVSLEFILQKHNLLTEVTYPVTCITPKNTRTITNSLSEFWYRHIKSTLYTGYKMEEYFGVTFSRATPAKALFDLLYLRHKEEGLEEGKIELAEELRLNTAELQAADWEEFAMCVDNSSSPKMEAVFNNLRRSA